jgi:hypothetical protein
MPFVDPGVQAAYDGETDPKQLVVDPRNGPKREMLLGQQSEPWQTPGIRPCAALVGTEHFYIQADKRAVQQRQEHNAPYQPQQTPRGYRDRQEDSDRKRQNAVKQKRYRTVTYFANKRKIINGRVFIQTVQTKTS